MKFRKVTVGAVTLAVMFVSCSGLSCFALSDAGSDKPDDIDQSTFETVVKIDENLNMIMDKNENSEVVCQSDIDELAALIDRFNDSIIKQNSGLSQIHFDIIWKVDFVTSQIPEKDKLDMRNIQKSIESFNNIVRLLKPRTESAEAVG